MAHIGNAPFGKTVRTVTSETLTSVKTAYYPTGGYIVGYVDVYVNGVRLTETADFTAADGTTVTLQYNPSIGDTVDVVTYGSIELANAVRRDGDTLVGTLYTRALVPTANVTYDIGTSTMRYKDLYLSGNTINLGDIKLSTNGTAFSVANTTGGTFPSALANTTITGTLFTNGAVTFANSTSNTFFVSSNGNVGLGKNDPAVKLHLYGPLNEILRLEASNTSYDASLRIHQNNTQITCLQGGVGVVGGGTWLATVPNSPLVLGTNNTPRLYVTANGFIGVANSTPTVLFHVKQARDSDWMAAFDNLGTNPYGLRVDTSTNSGTAYSLGVYTNTGTGLFVLNNGIVGVGTSSPNTKFEVASTTQTSSEISLFTTNTSGGVTSRYSFHRNYTGSSSARFTAAYIANFNQDDSNTSSNRQDLVFYTKTGTGSPSENMRVWGTGSVTKPNSPAFRAYLSTEWTTVPAVPNSGWTENFDQNNNFNQGTFTAPVAGVYKFGVMWDSLSTATTLSIRKNGATIAAFEPSYADGWESNQLHTVTYMSASDYVDIYVSGGGGSNPIHMGGGYWGYFYGYLVG